MRSWGFVGGQAGLREEGEQTRGEAEGDNAGRPERGCGGAGGSGGVTFVSIEMLSGSQSPAPRALSKRHVTLLGFSCLLLPLHL